jgi:hypothetical protein
LVGKIQAYGLEDNRVLLHEFTAVNADVSEIHYLPTSDAFVSKQNSFELAEKRLLDFL